MFFEKIEDFYCFMTWSIVLRKDVSVFCGYLDSIEIFKQLQEIINEGDI